MSFVDLEPEVFLQVLLYLDSPAAFRTRALAKIFAKSDFNLCPNLLKGTSVTPGSHGTKGGMWLHALVPEDVLSLYARLCSATKLAGDLKFTDTSTVTQLLKASCMFDSHADGEVIKEGQQFKLGYITRHGRPICLKVASQGSLLTSYMSRGQRFLGSWIFNPDSVRAMVSGKGLGVVYSSSVEFCAIMSCREDEVELGAKSPGKVKFGVQLMLSRTAGKRFVLSWQPCVTSVEEQDLHYLPEEHAKYFDVQLHGHAAVPLSSSPLGYEGEILASSTQMHITGDVPAELTCGIDDINELLDHDCLNCALNIHFYHKGHAFPVIATACCDPDAQEYPQCTESALQIEEQSMWSSPSPAVSDKTELKAFDTASRNIPLGGDDTAFLPQSRNVLEMTLCWLCVGISLVLHSTETSAHYLSVFF